MTDRALLLYAEYLHSRLRLSIPSLGPWDAEQSWWRTVLLEQAAMDFREMRACEAHAQRLGYEESMREAVRV